MIKFNLIDLIKRFKIKFIIALTLFAILILSFFFCEKIEFALGLKTPLFENQTKEEEVNNSKFKVSFIDVGQGGSTYLKFPDGKVMLIDGGDVGAGSKVIDFLKNEKVDKIDYLVATHADADHISGLNLVLKEFEVKNIYRPFQIAGSGDSLENFVVYEDEDLADFFKYINGEENNKTKISRITTNVYKEFITNIYSEFYQENGNYYKSNVTVFFDGLKISGENYDIEFFAPLVRDEKYNLSNFSNTSGFATMGFGITNSNDNSAIILVNIYDNKFLFTGDASWSSNLYEDIPSDDENDGFRKYGEIEFLNSLTDDEKLKFKDVSVYLLGHHGSSYSSGEDLLRLINSKFFIASVGENNDYKHPAEDTLARISDYKKSKDYLLSTENFGTITFGEIDGKLVYCLEIYEVDETLTISWLMLGTIIFVLTMFILFSLKSKKT